MFQQSTIPRKFRDDQSTKYKRCYSLKRMEDLLSNGGKSPSTLQLGVN